MPPSGCRRACIPTRILPIGYPMGKFGPVGRGSMKEFVYQDKWGQPYGAVA